jgi:hypothetical protein
MAGSHFDKRYPVVLRFEGIGPENLAGYETHRKRVGGDIGHVLKCPPEPNRRLIGSEDWAAEALAEISEIKAQNFAAELEALENGTAKKISNIAWRKVRTIPGGQRGTGRLAEDLYLLKVAMRFLVAC